MNSSGWVPRRTVLDEQEQQHVVEGLLAVLGALVVEDNAARAQAAVARWLERAAFTVEWEVPLKRWGTDERGVLDLVAQRGQLRLVIEIDREIPRAKALRKLRRVPSAVRVVLLRGGRWCAPPPEGIDAVVCLTVRR